jgi:hypothetical protein
LERAATAAPTHAVANPSGNASVSVDGNWVVGLGVVSDVVIVSVLARGDGVLGVEDET